MTADELRAFTLLTVMLTTHVGLFTLTNLWFRKGMAVCTKKMVMPNIALFILGNLWPLTWTAYLIYVACDWITGRVRHGRIQALIDENNHLEEQLTLSRAAVADLKEAYTSMQSQLDHMKLMKAAAEVSEGLRSLEQAKSPTSLPPYTPDVWKAIKELRDSVNKLELQIDGAVVSDLLKRMFVIENYLGKWDGSGNWIQYLEYAKDSRAKKKPASDGP